MTIKINIFKKHFFDKNENLKIFLVCAAIKEYAPQLTQNKISGSSAGAIAAAGLICNVCMSKATSTILEVVSAVKF